MSIYGPCPKEAKHLGRAQAMGGADLRSYAKKAFVLQSLGHLLNKAGDRMAGELDMGGFHIKNLPEVPTDGKDACSAAYAISIGHDCVTRDGGQGMKASLDMGGNKIIKVHDPTDDQHAVNRRFVVSHVNAIRTAIKPVITIWAEHSGRMDKFEYKFSFGDGSQGVDHRYCGYTMMSAGRILRMGLCATNANGFAAGKTTVTVMVDGEANRDYKVSKTEDSRSAFTVFDGSSEDKTTPLEVSPGSVINFMSTRADPKATATVVSLLIELDL